MTAIGIDYGTKYSAVSYLDSEGLPVLITDVTDINQKLTQSVVTLDAEYPLVGKEAKEFVDRNPSARLIKWSKLEIGISDKLFVDKKGRKWRHDAIAALVLAKLRKDVIKALKMDVDKLTLTVPVHFVTERRRAIMQAALLAGLPKPQLLEEPIAAALYYERNLARQNNTVLVYDFGAGTFDVSIIKKVEDNIIVLGKAGGREIGGKYLDQKFAKYLLNRILVIAKQDPIPEAEIVSNFEDDPHLSKILDLAEEWKVKLSTQNRIDEKVEYKGDYYQLLVTRSQFEKCTSNLIEQTIELTLKCLAASDLTWQDINNIYLVGGSSCIPKVEERVRIISGLKPSNIIINNPFEAVTLGAAIANSSDNAVSDKLPLGTLGVTVWDNSKKKQTFHTCIEHNKLLPSSSKEKFYTNRQNQHVVDLEISIKNTEGYLHTIGYCSFNLPKSCPINTQFEITIKYTEFSEVHVSFFIDKYKNHSNQVAMFKLEAEHEIPEWFEQQKALVQEFFDN